MGNTMSKSMSNNSWMSNGMGNRVCNMSHRVSNMSYRVGNSMCNWVGNSMSNWVGNNSWMGNSMSNWVGNSSWMGNSMSNWVSNSFRISSNSFICYIRNISIIVIGMIVNMLNATIGKINRVRSFHNTSTIVRLSLIESSTRVVISNRICVRIRRWFSKIRVSITCSMGNYRSMVNNWSMMNNRGMSNSMSYWMCNSYWVSNSMGYWMCNGYWVCNSMCNWVAYSVSKSMSKKAVCSRSSSNKGGKTGKSLHDVELLF